MQFVQLLNGPFPSAALIVCRFDDQTGIGQSVHQLVALHQVAGVKASLGVVRRNQYQVAVHQYIAIIPVQGRFFQSVP